MKINRIVSCLMAVLMLLCLLPAANAENAYDKLTAGQWEVRMPGFDDVTYMEFFPDGFGKWYLGDLWDIDFDWMLYERVADGYTVDEYLQINFRDDEGIYRWGYMNMPWQHNDYRLVWLDMHLFLTDPNHSGYDEAGYSAVKGMNLAQVEDIPFQIDGRDDCDDDDWYDDWYEDDWYDDSYEDDWYDDGWDDDWDEEDTDQIGVICKDNIFPRPRPGDGRNDYNYEAYGQEVTIHTRAMSLKGDEHWWLCISATIRAWGNTYELDHEWIREDYVDPLSYEFDRVPLDPEYGYSEYGY